MRKIIALVAISLTVNSYADCFQRKEIINIGGLPVDNQRESYIQQPNGMYKCNYSFRVLVDKSWQWAERIAEGRSVVQACTAARDSARTWLLERAPDFGSEVQQSVETVCDTRKPADVRAVKIGQVINLSDVVPHPRYVNADGTFRFIRPVDAPEFTCAVFIENEIRPDGVAVQHTGYLCQTGRNWTVWKKWESSRFDK